MAEKKTAQAAKKTVEAAKETAQAAAVEAEEIVKKTAAKAKKAADKTVKTVTKTAKAKSEEVKKAVEKAAAKDTFVLQVSGKEDIDVLALAEKAKEDYKAKGHRAPKNVAVYIKPEEGVAYYTVNGKGSDDFKIEL